MFSETISPARLSLFSWLMLVILLSVSLVLGTMALCNRFMFGQILYKTQERTFTAMMRASMEEMDGHFRNVEETIAQNVLDYRNPENRSLLHSSGLLSECLESHPSLCGAEIIFTEFASPEDTREFKALYAMRDEQGEIRFVDRNVDNDREAEWYQLPLTLRGPAWSEPYRDDPSGVLMITYSFPLMNEKKEPIAILTADVSLDWLDTTLASLPVGVAGESVLLSARQTFLACNQHEHILKETLETLADSYTEPKSRESLLRLSRTIRSAESGRLRLYYAPCSEEAWCYFRKHPEIGITLVCILPERAIHEYINDMTRWVPLFGLLGLLLCTFPAWWIAHSVALPLSRLRIAANQIAQGHFDTPLPTHASNGEIVSLIRSFDRMKVDLSHYVRDLTETTAARERLSASLNVAHDIQIGMVPKDFSSCRGKNVELYAAMHPAQEVGGDLYDFAFFDQNQFYFCIGDVSGKGIPASLFMAVGKTLLKSVFHSVSDPAEAMKQVNNELMQYNEAATNFITALCGFFDVTTGVVVCSYAGHNPPVLVPKEGLPRLLKVSPGLPLAVTMDCEYTNERFQLEPGDALFLYTDGVTEAMNPEGNCFGEERLLEAIQSCQKGSVQNCVETILKKVRHWANGAIQSDDITILMFARRSGE